MKTPHFYIASLTIYLGLNIYTFYYLWPDWKMWLIINGLIWANNVAVALKQ